MNRTKEERDKLWGKFAPELTRHLLSGLSLATRMLAVGATIGDAEMILTSAAKEIVEKLKKTEKVE